MVRSAALALTVLTGFSGLVYEVAWQKYVATLLGSHSEATAAVLGLFLGGLSLGYALFGGVTRRVVERAAAGGRAPRLLLLYGAVEGSIGIHALLFPWLFGAVRALSLAIAPALGGAGFAVDVALTALLILPPTVLMGGTIPILTQALARGLADATRFHAFVYAFNTAGAFLGALAAGFALVPWLGLERVVMSMGAINLAAGSAFAVLGVWRRGAAAVPKRGAGVPALGVYAALALLVGFSAMTFQTVLIRLGGLSLGSSQFTFSMVVAVFVFCIALGSFGVSALPRIPANLLVAVQWVLVTLMLLLYRVLDDAPYWAHVVRSVFRDDDAAFHPYHLSVFAGSLAVLLVPVGLSGATLPLIFHHLRREVGDLGRAAGRLYAWNTLGSLLGALLGGYVLLYWLDLDRVYLVAVAGLVLGAVLLTIRVFALPPRRTLAMVLVPALAGVALTPSWDQNRLSSGLFRARRAQKLTYAGANAFFDQYRPRSRTLFYEDDPNSSVCVQTAKYPDGREDVGIITNGKPDGSILVDYPTMALAALVPALFVDRLERAFVIGYGTGVTAGELGALDSTREVVVAEISPGVIEAGRFFERGNQGALGNPKTEIVVADAYRALLRSDVRYDVIVSEPSNPWVTGVEMLYSREFLQAARDRLRPGGVYAQWFHLYENETSVVELVLRTYAAVFDHVAVWYTRWPDVILLGFESDEHALDLDRVETRASQPDIAAGLARAGVESLPELLVHEMLPLGVVRAAGFSGDIHTIFHPVLSHRAARAFFRGQQASLPRTLKPAAASAGARNSLLHRYATRQEGPLPQRDYDRLTAEACQQEPVYCATLIASWLHAHPGSPAARKRLARLRRNPHFAELLRPANLQLMIRLFGGDGRADRAVPAETAQRATQVFLRHYLHGAPFSRSALGRLWERCQEKAPANGACARGRARAEEILGPLRELGG